MALSMIGIILGMAFLIYFVVQGWPLMFIGALAAMIVALFSGLNVITSYLEAYMNGFGGFLIGQIPIFLWGAIFGECYGVTGGAKSIARWLSKSLKGKNETLSPMTTVILVFLAGLILSYGGVSAIVLMFVMAPLTLELCKESNIPQYMAPGMILEGTVRNVVDFGAFVDIGVKTDGLVHISEMSNRRIKHPMDEVSVGEVVKVKVLNVDETHHKISLSMKIK